MATTTVVKIAMAAAAQTVTPTVPTTTDKTSAKSQSPLQGMAFLIANSSKPFHNSKTQMKLFTSISAVIATGALALTASPSFAQFYNVTPSYGGYNGGMTIRNNNTGGSTTFTPSYGGGGTYYNNNGGGGIVLPQGGGGYSVHSW